MFSEAVRTLKVKHEKGMGITPFHALMISTASRVGIGNISGVSTAIALGGAGAVFWMWMLAVLGGASSFVETVLGQMYKVKDGELFRGGPSYYIKQGMGKPWLGVLFSVFLVLTCAYGANALQAYNIMDSLQYYELGNHMPVFVGIILTILTMIAVTGGSKRISKFSAIIVPIMAGLYLAMTLVMILSHIREVPHMVVHIFQDAFHFREIMGGFSGSCIVYGVKRGLFSNEAGMGSAPNAASSAITSHPVKQGLVSVVSVFLDTIVICSATAFMLLLSGVQGTERLKGMPFVQQAIQVQFGQWGVHVLTLSIFFFAFTSIIGNYYYAENGLRFITKNPICLKIFRLTVIGVVFFGAQMDFIVAWGLADIFMGCMALVNLAAIFSLKEPALQCMKDYEQQRKTGRNPVFLANKIGIENVECWK